MTGIGRGGPALLEIAVGGDTADWVAAGFRVDDGWIELGCVRLEIGDVTPSFGFAEPPADRLLGVPCHPVPPRTSPDREPPAGSAPVHPNGCDGFDHVVLLAPDLAGVRAELEAGGFEIRRERDAHVLGRDAVQVFAWAGEALLEIVAPAEPRPSETTAIGGSPLWGSALWGIALWGIALTSSDLDATAAVLGPLASRPRDAVQSGRRILSIRRRESGLPLEVAVMSERATAAD